MNVRIHGRNTEIADDVRDLAHEKVEHAGRIFDDVTNVDVEFSENGNPRQTDGRYRVEITSTAAGQIVRVESDAFDARAALDAATEKYERQLRKLKERLIQRSRKASHKDLSPLEDTPVVQRDQDPFIVRRKRFAMRPMAVEEAVLQMEMLGHDFFVFLDADTGNQCVIYHRRDGNLGMIEPE
ncbi:MAG: ribosome-associated translation inhibitor RaiA, partial [Actinomycetota bacterium]|nr:ribosome-associated translation inhibitor RaiA [Actinomycetota bacterium]